MNPTSVLEDASLILGLTRWVKDPVAMSCGVGHRCGSDTELLWLWHRPAAVALIIPLAWEPPYALGAAQENGEKTKKEGKKERKKGPSEEVMLEQSSDGCCDLGEEL